MVIWNGTGTNTFITVLNGVNDISNGTVGVFFVILCGIIVYGFNAREPTREVVTGATFVCMIVAILGRTIGFVNEITLGLAVAAFLGALAMLIIKE